VDGVAAAAAAGPSAAAGADRRRRPHPVYNEPLEVVEPTVVAATRLRTAAARVTLLDDGGSPEMEAMARRHGVRYIHRPGRDGAKAGNLNWALARTDAPFVAVLDCDHVPDPRFLEVTLAAFDEPSVAFVQTPQYYANADRSGVAAAAWAQQSLFFGSIAVARDAMGAMFCCVPTSCSAGRRWKPWGTSPPIR